MYSNYSSYLHNNGAKITHFRCKKKFPICHFFHFSLHRLVFATTLFLFFFEKYYKAHIGSKLVYKTSVGPSLLWGTQEL